MSPLIDLTNTIIQKYNEEELSVSSTEDTLKEKDQDGNKHSSEQNTESKKSNTLFRYFHSRRKKHTKQNKLPKTGHADSEPKSTTCNTTTEVNGRVPPINSDDVLFSGIESLNLNPVVEISGSPLQTKSQSNQRGDANSCCSRNRISGSSNYVGPPPNLFSTNYKCVACGIEMPSIQNLTSHLVSHIMEGIQAAAWLNNAMSTLVTPLLPPVKEPSSSSVNSNRSNLEYDQTGHSLTESEKL